MVKKETLYIVALIAFGLGFVGGVIFAAIKSTPLDEGQSQQTASQAPARQDLSEAIAILEQQVATEPHNYEAWVRLGNAYYDTDQSAKAIIAYDKALAINNGSPDVWSDLGTMYRRTGQFDQAIESFNEAAQRDPSHIPSRFNRGIVLLNDLNDPAGAIAAWEEILQIDPNATTRDGKRLSDLVAELKAPSTGSGTAGQ